MTRLRATLQSFAVAALLSALHAHAQILKMAELNTTQIQALDRAHTVVLLIDGIVEEHGPYLPTFTDGYFDEAIAQDLARSLVARPGWTVVLFPTLPLGAEPANHIGQRWSFPGSFPVRAETMRAVYMDLADAIGGQGFQHVFIVDSHGGPSNSRALDQASDYFHQTYHGRMVHLLGLMPVLESCKALEQTLAPAQLAENGLSVHADAMEQATGLFLRPDLSPPGYATAPSLPGADFDQLIHAARQPAWPGYLGAPRFASTAIGALAYSQLREAVVRLAPQILDGKLDPATLPRYSDAMSQMAAKVETAREVHDASTAAQHAHWLAAHPVTPPEHP